MMIDTGSFGAQMTEQTEDNIAAEPTEEHAIPNCKMRARKRRSLPPMRRALTCWPMPMPIMKSKMTPRQ